MDFVIIEDDEELDELQFVLNGIPRQRLLATGSHLLLLGDFGGMHESTVSRIVKRVVHAVASQRPRFLRMNETAEERNRTQLGFYELARFQRADGVIDCTHIRIKCPGGDDPEIFRNRKGYHSMNTQVIGDNNLKVQDIVARWPGSVHDSTIFNNSEVKHRFDQNAFTNGLLLGDSGYYRRPYLLTPIVNPQTPAEERYNESHIRTRVLIENLFGIIKRRFPILAYGCRLKLETTLVIIVACVVLHNICIEQKDLVPPDPDDVELFNRVMEEDQVPVIPVFDENLPGLLQGTRARQELVDYFATLNDE